MLLLVSVLMQDGTFIIRDNTRNPGEYSLSLFYSAAVKHLRYAAYGGPYSRLIIMVIFRIRFTQNKYFLGEAKEDEMVVNFSMQYCILSSIILSKAI